MGQGRGLKSDSGFWRSGEVNLTIPDAELICSLMCPVGTKATRSELRFSFHDFAKVVSRRSSCDTVSGN